MILVDSSCWVDFYRPDGSRAIQDAVAEALESGEAATCGIIEVEILGFITRRREFEIVSADFRALHRLESSLEDFDRAVALGRDLRARGASAPATDLVVAAIALERDALLLHADRHFETIAKVAPLRHRHLKAGE
jgi:predicted nucleic acid-binding protein